MTVVHITLDGPPRGKGRPKFTTRKGRAMAFTDKDTQEYEARLKAEAKRVMDGRAPLPGPLRLQVEAIIGVPLSWSKSDKAAALAQYRRPTASPDLDNFIKITDALNGRKAKRDATGAIMREAEPGIVWNDDSQVVEIVARKRYGHCPRLELRIEMIDLEPAQASLI